MQIADRSHCTEVFEKTYIVVMTAKELEILGFRPDCTSRYYRARFSCECRQFSLW